MRSSKYIILFIAVIIATTACNKKLDVLPKNNITPDQITTESDVQALIGGTYTLMQSPYAFGEEFIFISDLLASENQVDFVGTFTNYKDVFNKQQTANNSIATLMWENAYEIISNSNTILNKIDLVSADNQDEFTGEAEFMRGVTYFMLVNYFGKPYSAGSTTSNPGVPIVLAPAYDYDSTKDKPSRASVEDVYKQAIADLTDAVNKLPESNGSIASSYSAKAFLARIYLNMGNYEMAAQMADDVIESGNYNLNSTFDKAFNNSAISPEDVFSIQQTNQSNAGTTNNGLTTFYTDNESNGGRGDAQINSGYFDYFTNSDFRGNFYYDGFSISGIEGNYTEKWSQFYKVIPVIRLSEMYLTRAEANLMKGGTPIGNATPLEDVNTVRLRSGAKKLTAASIDDIIDERFRELGFEGDRLWTLKRNKIDIDGLTYDANELVLPIPQRETDVNSNLEQNPGY